MEKNDYELVYLAQEGNEDAINLLYKKYKPIIVKKSKNAIIFLFSDLTVQWKNDLKMKVLRIH